MQEAHKYWVIKTKPNGEWYVGHEWLRTTDGLETYSTEAQAQEGLRQRIEKRVNEGACPRCYFPSSLTTDRDLTHLPSVTSAKGGALLKCTQCKTHWFTQPGKPSIAYAPALADYIIEWCARPLQPSPLQYTALQSIGNITDTPGEQLYAAQVTLANGTRHDHALIRLGGPPPSEADFEYKVNWHYIDTVTAIAPSVYAYPRAMASAILAHPFTGSDDYVYLKDEEGIVYMMSASIGVFMPEELIGKQLRLINKPYKGQPAFIGVPNDYEGLSANYLVDPRKIVHILGDLPSV